MQNNVLNTCIIYHLNITSKSGEKLELTEVFTKFEIYEDIFTHFLSGTLAIRDTSDMLKNFPIIGGEHVEIAFADSHHISARFFDFYVDEVVPQIIPSDELNKNTLIILKLKSWYWLNSRKLRYSFMFEDTTQGIVSGLMSDVGSFKTVQSTDSKQMKFVSNFWNIEEILDYICYQNNDTLFFETPLNHNLKTVSSLVSQSPTQEIFMLKNLEGKAGINTVLQYHFDKYFAVSKMYDSNGFGKTSYQPQMESYNHKIDFSTLDEIYDTYKLMGQNKPFLPALSTYDNDIDVEYDDLETSIKRNIILSTLQHYNLIAILNGSFNRSVGDVISFNLPPFDNTPMNQNFHGNWLITQIKHTVTANFEFKQNVRLFKNAFFNNPKVG